MSREWSATIGWKTTSSKIVCPATAPRSDDASFSGEASRTSANRRYLAE